MSVYWSLCVVYVFVLYQTRVPTKAMSSVSSLQHNKRDAYCIKQCVKKSLNFRVLCTLNFNIIRYETRQNFEYETKSLKFVPATIF